MRAFEASAFWSLRQAISWRNEARHHEGPEMKRFCRGKMRKRALEWRADRQMVLAERASRQEAIA